MRIKLFMITILSIKIAIFRRPGRFLQKGRGRRFVCKTAKPENGSPVRTRLRARGVNAVCELALVRPSALYAGQVMSYKEEMTRCKESFDGCAGLEEVQSFDEWIDFEERLKKKYKGGYVLSTTKRSALSGVKM